MSSRDRNHSRTGVPFRLWSQADGVSGEHQNDTQTGGDCSLVKGDGKRLAGLGCGDTVPAWK
jgi:hypothetical protein